jgi:hypothetical protein
MGFEATPRSVEYAIIVGALILVFAAFLVSLYVYRQRNRPTRAPETVGPGDPPAVIESLPTDQASVGHSEHRSAAFIVHYLRGRARFT